jgi:hypothetical protein
MLVSSPLHVPVANYHALGVCQAAAALPGDFSGRVRPLNFYILESARFAEAYSVAFGAQACRCLIDSSSFGHLPASGVAFYRLQLLVSLGMSAKGK